MTPASRFPWRVFARLMVTQIVIVLLAMAGSGLTARYYFRHQQIRQVSIDLGETLGLLARAAPARPAPAWCVEQSRGTQLRLTVVDADGHVLCDSHRRPGTMESHAGRPEIVAARAGGTGESVRHSQTLDEDMLYRAQRLPDARTVLRAAIPLTHLQATLRTYDSYFAGLLALLSGLLLALAFWMATRLVRPMGALLSKSERILRLRPPGREAPDQPGAPRLFGEWKRLDESLDAAERMRIDFVANVTHELKTPLTCIKGYADTLLMDMNEGASIERDHVESISRHADRLARLIHDLLDLSSIESGVALRRETLEPDPFTREVLEQLSPALDAKARRIEIASELPAVHADPARLTQVLVNLIDNANKYTPPGGAIRVRWRRGEGGDCLLQVCDDGPGIPAEHQARLFERFHRLDASRSREVDGTGLGLSIVKHIVQRHGGDIQVESAPGAGSTFTCRFPATR